MRQLLLVLGDQLDPSHPLLTELDPQEDAIWMAEVLEESTHVASHKQRSALFLSAMRHARENWRSQGFTVHYHELSEQKTSLQSALAEDLQKLKPDSIIALRPGDWRVQQHLDRCAEEHQCPLHWQEDPHFLCSREEFSRWAAGRKQLRMEYFYREMRRSHNLLLEEDGSPCGGSWNYDADNRSAFPAKGPPPIPEAPQIEIDALTQSVIDDVQKYLPENPGSLEHFSWPCTTDQAEAAFASFLEFRLPYFGQYQDAMWTGEAFLFHARISSSLNLKLLNPLECCRRVEEAWRQDTERIPLAAAEGFIRQILGWREYVRGIYDLKMPEYLELNELQADADLPDFYWTGESDMACLRDAVSMTLETGYAHHIQRLMVTGLYPLLLGVEPRQVHEWYLAMYVDAVEWVELPNTLGMSQFADGGILGSKPYAATGKYIDRQSPYCKQCRFNPAKRTGPEACPFTTLYWDFLARNRETLQRIPRMNMQLRNLNRIRDSELEAIQQQAESLKKVSP